MSSLRAGFGTADLSASIAGAELVGYANREGGATGAHDPLLARAMVLEAGGARVAVCGLDLCYVGEDVVAAARDRLESRSLVSPDALFVSASHTHSGPHDADPAAFPGGLPALIEAAVAQACERLEPARIGAGYGMVDGVAVNRRRLEEPIDPCLMVVRVDSAAGRPLGVWYGYACHPVVLGPDNRLASADWVGSCSRALESQLGDGAVAVFGQGACADVNPMTDAVRARLAAGPTVSSAGFLYSGSADGVPWEIGDRTGGTFAEADHIGAVVAAEALRVHRGIAVGDAERVWARRLLAELAAERPLTPEIDPEHPCHEWDGGVRARREQPLETMLLGVDGPGILLAGQPGEVFVQTGVSLRRELRAAGFAHSFVVGCANGWRLYLPPREAFADGGYEVDWARVLGLPERLQDDFRTLVRAALA